MRAQPIRNIDKLYEVEQMLAQDNSAIGKRRYLMFMCGIYLGRRISDLLPLRVNQLRGTEFLSIREKKTKKRIELPIPERLQIFVRRELKGLPEDQYVFLSSHTSHKRQWDKAPKPIDRKTAYNDMKAIAAKAGIDYNVSTHTMRKTFGYHYYRRTKDIATLMVLFNHHSERETKIYIGIELDEMTEAVRGFRY